MSYKDIDQIIKNRNHNFDFLSELVVVLDKNNKIVYASKKIKAWTGCCGPEELVGKNLLDCRFFSEIDKLKIIESIKNTTFRKNFIPHEIELLSKNKKKLFVKVMGFLLRNKADKQDGCILLISNITSIKDIERKLLESEEKYKNIINSLPNSVIIVDLNGKIIDCNQPYALFCGLPVEKLIGRSSLDFMTKETKNYVINNIKKELLKNGYVKDKEGIFINKDKNEIYAEFSISVVKDKFGKPNCLAVISKDISDRKKNDIAKTEFISFASHQLKTPLSTMNWYLETALDKKTGTLNPLQRKCLKMAYKSNQQLINLSNTFLDVSRAELDVSNMNGKNSSVIDIINSVINKLLPPINSKNLEIKKDFPEIKLFVKAGPNAIGTIFQNLIYNSIKYTPKNGIIKITVKQQKNNVLVVVKDSGIGIPENQILNVFDKFFRADNVKNKDLEGFGLGLYVVKLLVDRIGGKIWVKSKENKGSSFFVKMPLKQVDIKI